MTQENFARLLQQLRTTNYKLCNFSLQLSGGKKMSSSTRTEATCPTSHLSFGPIVDWGNLTRIGNMQIYVIFINVKFMGIKDVHVKF